MVKFRLDNGLTVILEPIPGVVSVSVGLWVKTGSRDENDRQYGYAHFVEHMLFKGTERHSARDLARIIDRVGGQHNAATNREYTCYYINVVSDYLDLAVSTLADMYYHSVFDSGEMEKEKNVIMEEIKMYEDTPDEFIHDLFMECMYEGHPLSHSILGTKDSITGASRESMKDFFSGHYRNSNAILVITGRFTEDAARRLVDDHFTPVSGDITGPVAPAAGQPQRVPLRHIDRDLEQVHFCLGTEGIRRVDEDRWSQYAMSTILGGSMSSRLFQNIREQEGLAYSIYSFHSSYTDNGVFGIYCATAPDKFRRALELIIEECRTILNKGVTDEELQDARDFMKGNLALSLESVEVQMGQLAKNEISFQRHFSYEDMVEQINAISRESFERVCRRIFNETRLSLVSVGRIKKADQKNIALDL